jgi:Sulfotransferase family
VTTASREQLLAEWGRYWNPERAVLAEKSPPNLVRTRFLQALFPGAVFVMMIRHPVAVACATRKWARSSYEPLIRHWVRCHEILAEDAPAIERLHIVHYEHFVLDPRGETARIVSLLGLDGTTLRTHAEPHLNDRYFAAWHSAGTRLGRSIRDRRVLRHEAAVTRFGYSLVDLDRLPPRWTLMDGLAAEPVPSAN